MSLALSLLGCWGSPPAPSAPEPRPAERPARAAPPGEAPAHTPDVPRRAVVVKPGERREAWADARCNDGTPFAYTYRPGTEPIWVVNLAGGYFCEDQRLMCADRKPRLRTTLPPADGSETRRMKRQGVFGLDPSSNPIFASAHHVDAHYCSSDLWLGERTDRQPNSADPDGWYFSGRRNVAVLLDALQELHGLSDEPPHQVLLLGTSAGGAGVVGNLDQVIEALPRLAAEGRLKVVLDGSWVADLPADVQPPDADRWGPLHRACAQRLVSEGQDPVRCVIGTEWWPHVRQTGVPVLVQISGLDATQAPVFGIDQPDEQAAWRDTVRSSLSEVPWVFSGGHSYHVVAIDPLFTRGQPGRRFVDLLGRFWRGEEPEQVFFRYP